MKLVPKLALALFVGVFVVVFAFTAFRVNSEIELFDQDVRRDQRIVGLTAGAALSKTRTRDEAIKLARRVDASRETMRIRFVSLATNSPRRRPTRATTRSWASAPESRSSAIPTHRSSCSAIREAAASRSKRQRS